MLMWFHIGWLWVAPAGLRATKASKIHYLWRKDEQNPPSWQQEHFCLLVQIPTLWLWACMNLRVCDIEGKGTESSSATQFGQKMGNRKQQELDSLSDFCTCVNKKIDMYSVCTEMRVGQINKSVFKRQGKVCIVANHQHKFSLWTRT